MASLEEYRARKRAWYHKNKEKVKAKQLEYRSNNREKVNACVKNSKAKNKESVRKYNKEYREREKQNPEKRLRYNLRSRISWVLKKRCNVRSSLVIEFLGCSLSEFKIYIESQFNDGMNWDNYGKNGWHLDHIIPVSRAKTQEEFKKLSHYTNFQPLWAKDNRQKSNK